MKYGKALLFKMQLPRSSTKDSKRIVCSQSLTLRGIWSNSHKSNEHRSNTHFCRACPIGFSNSILTTLRSETSRGSVAKTRAIFWHHCTPCLWGWFVSGNRQPGVCFKHLRKPKSKFKKVRPTFHCCFLTKKSW